MSVQVIRHLSTHVLHNAATCFGQLYGHLLVTRAHKTKITTAIFILGQNVMSNCCTIHIIIIISNLSNDRSKKPLAKRFLHIMRSRASSFNSQYPLLSLRSSSNFLRLLPCLLVTFICPFIFPSVTCFRRQFLRNMWPTQLAFRFIISCRIFLC